MDSVRELITRKGYLSNSQDEYGNTPLYYAALHGHCEMIKVLVNEFSCNINVKGQYGNSLIHAACQNGHLDCVRMLVMDFGCNPMEKNVYNNSPVHAAAQFGHESIIKVLVREFNSNARIMGQYRRTPLHAACQGGYINVVWLLILEMECDPSEKDEDGNAPIHIAALHGQKHVVELLVRKFGCSAEETGQHGRTPLHFACHGGHVNVVCLLLLEMECEQSEKDEYGNAPIHIAAVYGQEIIVKLLVETFGCIPWERGQYGKTPLHYACQGGHVNLVRWLLLDMNCDPLREDEHSNAPIHISALHGQEHVVELLVEEFGCNAGEKGQYGSTPLHFVCQGGHVNVVRWLLLQMKCDPSEKDELGNAPIHYAALHGQQHVIKLLVEEFGCNAGEKGQYGSTPLHFACQGGHVNVVRWLLLQMKCDPSEKDELGNAPIHYAALHGQQHVIKLLVEEFGRNAGEKGQFGETPLHFACKRGHINVVCWLALDMKCNPSGKDEHGNAPIHIAALHGQENVIKLLVEEFGCNAGEKGQYGRTALHAACQGGNVKIVSLLILKMECASSVTDDDGNTPLHIAALNGQYNVIKVLINEFHFDVGVTGQYGWTPLHSACYAGHVLAVLKLITEFNVEIIPKDDKDHTPFDIAVLCGHNILVKEFAGIIDVKSSEYKRLLSYAYWQRNWDLVRILITKFKCDPSVCIELALSSFGTTPLHIACRNNDLELVHMLITKFNVNTESTDEMGSTPLEIALAAGNPNVMKEFVGHFDIKSHPWALHHACRSGNLDAASILIAEFNYDPDTKDNFGNTPLHISCWKNNLAIVHMLIVDCNVDTNTRNPNGFTPLEITSWCGNVEIVKEFAGHVDINSHPQALRLASKRGYSEVVRVLITELNFNPELQDKAGNTPLFTAALYGHQYVVKLLVTEFGCNAGASGKYGTPLHAACLGGYVDVVDMLISFNVDTMVTDEENITPFEMAVKSDKIEIVKQFVGLVHVGNRYTIAKRLLSCACTRRNSDMLQILIVEFGCDPTVCDSVDYHCSTPLHVACRKGDLDMVHGLICDCNVDTSKKDEEGVTPLEIAVMSENIGIVKEFVGHIHLGSQPSEAEKLLQYACERESLELIRILTLSFGCNPYMLDDDSPLCIACRNGAVDLIHTLISEFGVDTGLYRYHGIYLTALEIAASVGNIDVIKEFIGHVNIEDHPDALHQACLEGHVEVVQMLISECGCDAMVENEEGWTGLELAVQNNRTEVIKELASHVDLNNHQFHTLLHDSIDSRTTDKTIKLLLQLGVNMMSRDEDGYLPIHVAAQQGRIDIVSTLVNDFNCNPAVRGPGGTTPLHGACFHGHLDLVRLLVTGMKCDLYCQDDDGNTPLHITAGSLADITPVIRELVQQNSALLDCQNKKQETLLHLVVKYGRITVVEFLLSELSSNLLAADIDGNTPLHVAAREGRLDIVKQLIEQYAAPLDCWNNNHQLPIHLALERKHENIVNIFLLHIDGNTPLHIATIHGEPEGLRLLIQQSGNPHCLNSKNQTPLHLAAGKGNEMIVKMLISEFNCSPAVKDTDGNTPLHMAAIGGRAVVLKELAEQYGSPPDCQNNSLQTPLHLAVAGGHQEIIFMLMSEFHCNVNVADVDGNTILHLATKKENVDVDLIISLLSEYKVCSNTSNSSGHTPLYYATLNRYSRIVAELIKYDCNPAAFDKDYKILEQISQKKLSDGSLTKVFVIGNKCVGKSTLIEALRNESQQNSFFTTQVTPHTAGIIPLVHHSEQYGRVLFYDFAGDPEYYSSHAAALERLLTSSCHIFLLVEDFSEEEDAILRTLGYWLTFISYNSKDLQTKSQVIIVGSHADIIESKGEDSERKVCEVFTELSLEFRRYHPYIEMVGYCSLDCRKSQSKGTENLYNLLKHCCFSSSNDDNKSLSVGAVLLLGVLQRDFKGVIACEVSQICRHIELTEMYLPQGVVTIYSYLQELNAQGVVLILGNREGLSEEWVILDVSEFLATVHKNLFSSSSLSHVCRMRSLSNLGLISESDLKNVLDRFDVKFLKQCLKYLQYCIELDDSEVLKKIFGNSYTTVVETNTSESSDIFGRISTDNTGENNSSAHTTNCGSKLLFFPALLKDIQRSSMDWFCKESHASCKGWYIGCDREYDYFPPRFLHVLLLRLAFNFTLPVYNRKQKNSDLCSRRCSMWKSGIHWLMKTGVECVVEVVKQSTGVVVMIKSVQECDADCACTFSEIVGKVLEAKQEFCHSLVAKEYLIDPDDMNKDFIPSIIGLHLFDMIDIEDALTENQRAVVSVCGQKALSLSRLQINRMWSKLF